jgi:hypothetical protein
MMLKIHSPGVGFLIAAFVLLAATTLAAADDDLMVYKNPGCGCCSKWASRLEDAGFSVAVTERSADNAQQRDFKIRAEHRSCHTAVVDDRYVFEGHIPAELIRRFLDAQPADAFGLAVPGMPVGSPGMEAGDRIDPYDVLLLKTDGSVEVYAHVERPQADPPTE